MYIVYTYAVFQRVVFYEYFKYLFACAVFMRKKVLYLLFGLTRIKGHVFIFIIVILHRFQMNWTTRKKNKTPKTRGKNNNTPTNDGYTDIKRK